MPEVWGTACYFQCGGIINLLSEPHNGSRLHVYCPNCRSYVVAKRWFEQQVDSAMLTALRQMVRTVPLGKMLLVDLDGPQFVDHRVARATVPPERSEDRHWAPDTGPARF